VTRCATFVAPLAGETSCTGAVLQAASTKKCDGWAGTGPQLCS
jgi:hypothetical protein